MGLANKTFQKILEHKKTHQNASEFIAQKSDSSEQTVRPASHKRSVSVKPSVLVFSACAGFLFVVALAFSTSLFDSSNSNNAPKPTQGFANNNSPSNNPTDFAVTGSSPSQLLFCSGSGSVSESAAQAPFSNDLNSFAVNSSEKVVDLTGSSVPSVSEHREKPFNMACPDSVVVLSPLPEGLPIIIVQPRHFPGELRNIQEFVNQPNADFVVPVNYQK